MAGDISVKLRADPGQFVSGVDKAIAAIKDWEQAAEQGGEGASDKLEGATRAVVELGRMTGKSADETKRALEGIGYSAKDAADAFEAVGREAQQAGDKADSSARGAGDSVAKISDKASTAGDGLRSLGDIAKQALSGDLSGAADSALSSISDMAVSAGVGGAVGGGLVTALGGLVAVAVEQLDLFGEKTAAIRDDVSQSLVEMGGAFDAADLEGRMRKVVNTTDQWNAANTIAQATGQDVAEVVRALAGDQEALATTTDQYSKAVVGTGGAMSQAMRDALGALTAVGDGMNDAAGKTAVLDRAINSVKSTTQATKAASDILRESFDKPYAPQTAVVKMQVDDSAVRNYVPPRKQAVVDYKAAQTAWQ